MGKKKGIDISYWQGNINFAKVKADGIQFAILREGYRQTVDGKFHEYVQGCKYYGIPVLGVYHFSYALNVEQAIQEAVFCIEQMKKAGLGKDVIVFFDFEYDTITKAKNQGVHLGSKECNAHTKAFCEYVTSQGYKAGIYSNIDYYKNMYDKNLLEKYVFWLADYSGEPDYSCTFQQYTSSGKVNGINGNVDMDYYFESNQGKDDNMKRSASAVVAQAQAWVGCKESNGTHKKIIDVYNAHKPLARGYAVKYTDAWCATFVSACAIKAGVTDILPTECGCEPQINLFKKLGEWVENDGYVPKAGDVIFYDWDDNGVGDCTGYSDHVGIVEKVVGSTITIIEGNKNNAVERRNIQVNARYIRGYGVPKYDVNVPNTNTGGKKSVAEIAKEVIQGKWGNGDDRKNRLTKAGYNYNEVQAKVNELLGGASKPVKPSKSIDEIAKEVINGKWGNGEARKTALEKAGYKYADVQARVNALMKGTSSSKKSITEIAKEVIQGKWGNGDDRKNRLTKAGYNYNEVQKKVNELLK